MAQSKTWKYNDRDREMMEKFLLEKMAFAQEEEERCRKQYHLTNDQWSLGQIGHWQKFRNHCKYLFAGLTFKQKHERPEGY